MQTQHQSNISLVASLTNESHAARILGIFRFEDLGNMTRRQLGLPPKMFERLQAGIEAGRRIQETRSGYKAVKKISSSSDAIQYAKREFSRLMTDGKKEEFHIVTLDTKNQVIDTHHISTGTLDSSLVHPREVFRPAIKDSAASIICVHNHPSGDPTPSREDFAVTRRLTESGKMIGIDVLDHVVLGNPNAISIREAE